MLETWRGYRLGLYGPRMGPIDNFSLVTGSYQGVDFYVHNALKLT